MKDKGRSRGQRKKEKKEWKEKKKKFKKKRRQEMGRTFLKTRNIASFIYSILGIIFFTITFLILFGILNVDTIVSWFGG